jgi:hypothetical protein
MWHFSIDIVTLIRYRLGTVKNCESPAAAAVLPEILEPGGASCFGFFIVRQGWRIRAQAQDDRMLGTCSGGGFGKSGNGGGRG